MRQEIDLKNAWVISRNMLAYYAWHSLVSTQLLKATAGLLYAVNLSEVPKAAVAEPIDTGVQYMTIIGLAFRLSMAFSKRTNDTKGFAHAAFTYLYNEEYVGVLTNRRTLQAMMLLGLAYHSYFSQECSTADHSVKELLYKMLLPSLIGAGLDAVTHAVPLRNLVTNKLAGLSFLASWCIWGGAAAPGTNKADLEEAEANIHNPFK